MKKFLKVSLLSLALLVPVMAQNPGQGQGGGRPASVGVRPSWLTLYLIFVK